MSLYYLGHIKNPGLVESVVSQADCSLLEEEKTEEDFT